MTTGTGVRPADLSGASVGDAPANGQVSASQRSQIFRAAALDHLVAPDRLDLGARIVRPGTWLLMLAGVLFVVTIVVGSAIVKVPIKTATQGILLNPSGLKEVVSLSAGQIRSLKVRTGQKVTAGEEVAVVGQPDAALQLDAAGADMKSAKEQLDRISAFQDKTAQSLDAMRRVQLADLDQAIGFARQNVKLMDERLGGQTGLAGRGMLPKPALDQTTIELSKAREELARLLTSSKQLAAKALEEQISRDRELLTLQLKYDESVRQVGVATDRLNRLLSIKSPYTGVVAELKLNEGDVVANGTSLLTVLPARSADDADGARLVATLYVQPADGKRVQPGMAVEIVPSTIKREEFGFISGRVRSVAELPSTTEGMMRTLRNQKFVQSLTTGGAPFEIIAELDENPSTVSGYRWSSSAGPPVSISDGSPCNAEIVTRSRTILQLLVPAVRKLFDDFV